MKFLLSLIIPFIFGGVLLLAFGWVGVLAGGFIGVLSYLDFCTDKKVHEKSVELEEMAMRAVSKSR